MQIEYAKVSALGDRQDNQDRAAVVVSDEAALMLVFDGMGGHSDGALAAETGLKVVQDLFMAARQPIFDPQGFLYMALARHMMKSSTWAVTLPSTFDRALPARFAWFRKAARTGRILATAAYTRYEMAPS